MQIGHRSRQAVMRQGIGPQQLGANAAVVGGGKLGAATQTPDLLLLPLLLEHGHDPGKLTQQKSRVSSWEGYGSHMGGGGYVLLVCTC